MSGQGDEESQPRILGVDTDVLVHWTMTGALHHQAIREFLDREVRQHGRRLGIAQQSLHELVHVVTDPRRFEHPMSMEDALQLSRELWHSGDVERVLPTVDVHDRVCELMGAHRLGRKRILDTALAATFEAAGISRLATLNSRDFQIFTFLEVADPRDHPSDS